MLPLTPEEQRQDKLNDHWTELALGMWENRRTGRARENGAVESGTRKLLAKGVTQEEIDQFKAGIQDQIEHTISRRHCSALRPSPSPGPEPRYGSNGRG